MTHNPIQYLIFCLMTACLAITYRRYLIQDGGLLAWWPGLLYKAFPVKYEKWTGMHKAVEKILITCATCPTMKIKWGNVLLWLIAVLIVGAISVGFWLLKMWVAFKIFGQ